jgi:hypothetical protein
MLPSPSKPRINQPASIHQDRLHSHVWCRPRRLSQCHRQHRQTRCAIVVFSRFIPIMTVTELLLPAAWIPSPHDPSPRMGNQAVLLLLGERAYDLLPWPNLRLLERFPLKKIIINYKACWVTSALRYSRWEIWIHPTLKRCYYQHHHPRWWDPCRMPAQRIRTERSVACNRHRRPHTSILQ